jgi:hypothetical protein
LFPSLSLLDIEVMRVHRRQHAEDELWITRDETIN